MGFLEKIGLKTSKGDRVFLGMVLPILIHLLWMRTLEKYLTLWPAFFISLALLVILVKWG